MASGKIHVNLTEEVERDLYDAYEHLCDDISVELKQLAEQAGDLCRKVQYEPTTRAVDSTIQILNGEIASESQKIFRQWVEGEGSFVAAMRKSQAGESAIQTARQMESRFEELFNNFWQGRPMGDSLTTPTERPQITDEDFDELKKLYEDAGNRIKDVYGVCQKSLKSKSQDDKTYEIIVPAVEALGGPVVSAFGAFSKKIGEAKTQSQQLDKQQREHDQEAARIAKDMGSKAEDLTAAMNMFSDI